MSPPSTPERPNASSMSQKKTTSRNDLPSHDDNQDVKNARFSFPARPGERSAQIPGKTVHAAVWLELDARRSPLGEAFPPPPRPKVSIFVRCFTGNTQPVRLLHCVHVPVRLCAFADQVYRWAKLGGSRFSCMLFLENVPGSETSRVSLRITILSVLQEDGAFPLSKKVGTRFVSYRGSIDRPHRCLCYASPYAWRAPSKNRGFGIDRCSFP